MLAEERLPAAGRVPWTRVHVFWGDECCVPPSHADSNFRAANEALLSRVPIPQANIHRITSEMGTPATVAELYEDEIVRFFHLVAGEALRESRRLVACTTVPQTGASRITLTLPVLNRARAVASLVSGEMKAEVLVRIFERGEGNEALPAGLVRPEEATVLWLVDRPAARLLHPRASSTRDRSLRR